MATIETKTDTPHAPPSAVEQALNDLIAEWMTGFGTSATRRKAKAAVLAAHQAEVQAAYDRGYADA